MTLHHFALQRLPRARGTGQALWCAVVLAVLLPAAAAAQTQPAPGATTPLIPPSHQYPGIRSEPLAPPPGAAPPSLGTPQTPAVTTPASPLPPNVITPASPPAASVPGTAAPPSVTAPAIATPTAPAIPQPGANAGAPQTTPGQAPAAAGPPPPNPWLPQGAAVVQVLDKPDAQSTTLTIKAGQSATWRSLTIAVKACEIRPPDMVPDATAYLDVTDSHPGQPGFSGWMLSSDPSLNMMQNPIYNVQVKGCAS